jgi:hypothetical protein
LALVVFVGALFLGKVVLLHLVEGIPIGNLTRDPVAVAGLPAYTGYLSQVGILFWSAAAAISIFCAVNIRQDASSHGLRAFLVCSGLLTLMLGFDDAFLIHEEVLPHAGVPEKVVFAGYGSLFGLFLCRFFRLIAQTEFVVLAFALSLFGFSVSMDSWLPSGLVEGSDEDFLYLLEDGTKLTGVIGWLAYLVLVAREAIRGEPGLALT